VFVDEDWSFFEEFYECYVTTMDRVDAPKRYYFPREYFINLRKALGSSLHLCVACIEDDVASASLFTEVCSIVQYHLSGSQSRYASIPTTKLILHHMRAWAKHRGNSVLHLGSGAGGKADGVFFFKAGFSPSRHRLSTWRTIIDLDAYCTLLNERRHLAGLPPSAAPDLDRYFPEYRSSHLDHRIAAP
jgi:predicted N-acyltransferase